MKITPRTFYRASLLLPVLVPVLLFNIFATLLITLVFGGVAYVIFAIFMFFWLKKYNSGKEMFVLSLKAPIIFIPIQAIIWMVQFYIEKQSNPGLVGGW